MISENEQKKLKKILFGHYSKEIQNILAEQNVTNRNGVAYSSKYIRMVFQGFRSNIDIESAIWELATEKKNKMNLKNIKKENL